MHELFKTTSLSGHSNLKQFVQRIEKLSNIVKYHKSGSYHELPYNGITAKWDSKRE